MRPNLDREWYHIMAWSDPMTRPTQPPAGGSRAVGGGRLGVRRRRGDRKIRRRPRFSGLLNRWSRISKLPKVLSQVRRILEVPRRYRTKVIKYAHEPEFSSMHRSTSTSTMASSEDALPSFLRSLVASCEDDDDVYAELEKTRLEIRVRIRLRL